ncbi:MAG: DMT family transporter [Bacteroidaceae bacterium]|nr:DMT family transporter [Bacteroidaceae bacterium]
MKGESIALLVAVLWTTGAIFGELASKRLGALPLNVIRMVLSLLILGIALWFMVGQPYPYLADKETWMWLSLSGLMGFGFGDYCLFNSYMLIGSRFSQLFMTLAAPFAAITAWFLLGEHMTWLGLIGMVITLTGIGMSILGKDPQGTSEGSVSSGDACVASRSKKRHIAVKLPIHGVVFGIGAALGQGVGLVLSKVGLEHYTASAPLQDGMSSMTYPVGGTMIRALTGLLCFLLLLIMKKKVGQLKVAVRDGRGMHFAFWATMLGPAVGVSLSLLAVQYTSTGVAQTLMALTPVLIIWPSYLIFKSKVTAQEIFGAIIAVCGAALFFL